MSTKPALSPRRADDLLRVGLFWPTSRTQVPTAYVARQNPDVVDLAFQQRLAREVEGAGFDFVLMADGYTGVSDESRRIGHLDPTTNAVLWALPIFEATKRLGVISTMHPTFMEPAHVAAYGAALDRASNGRWAWNITTGFREEEAQLFGLDGLPDHDTRYRMAEEFVEIVTRLWSGEHVTWAGEHYSVDGALPGPTPVQVPFPTLVNAGASADAKRFAGRLCDYVFGSSSQFGYAGELTEELRQVAAESGRDDAARPMLLCQSLLRDSTAEAVAEMTTILLARDGDEATVKFVAAMAKGSESSAAATAAAAAADSPMKETDLVGSPDDVAEKIIVAYREHGLRGLMVSLPTWWPEDIRRYSRMFDSLRKAGVWLPSSERSALW